MTEILIIAAVLILISIAILAQTVVDIRLARRKLRAVNKTMDQVDELSTRMNHEPNRFWFRTGRDSAVADMHEALRDIATKDGP